MTDDHHDNRYEDGEPIPVIDWDFTPEAATEHDHAIAAALIRAVLTHG